MMDEEDTESLASALKVFVSKGGLSNSQKQEAINNFLEWVALKDDEKYYPEFEIW